MIPTLATDPCGRAEKLRELRDSLVTGGRREEVEFIAGNGTRRKVRYSRADFARLDREIAEADEACARLNGKRGRRFVIGGRP